jgi:hypothetical protein
MIEHSTIIFAHFSPFCQLDSLTRTVNGSRAHHVLSNPFFSCFCSQPRLVNDFETIKKSKKKKGKRKKETQRSRLRLKVVDFLSHLNFKQQGALEGGVKFLKSKNVVFTVERSNICGDHLPLRSPCIFEDFIY